MNADEKNLIIDDIIRYIESTQEHEIDLRKIIKNSIIDNNISSNINTKNIVNHLKKTFPEINCKQINNGHYRIIKETNAPLKEEFKKCINVKNEENNQIKENDTTTEEVIENNQITENTRLISYSILIIINIFFTFIIYEPSNNIIKPIFFIALTSTYILSDSKTLKFLFYFSCLYIIYTAQNLYIIVFILFISSLYIIPNYINLKKYKMYTTLTIIFLVFFMTTLQIDSYINIFHYMLSKSITILIIFSLFIWVNNLNIIHTSLMLIISFSIYNLLFTFIETLNNKDLIFRPYLEKFNFEYSIISLAVTILIFSVPYLINFFKIFMSSNDWKKTNLTSFFSLPSLFILSISITLFFYFLPFISFVFINIEIMALAFLFLYSVFIFIIIHYNQKEINNKQIKSIINNFNKNYFSVKKNTNLSVLNFIETFYKPLQIDKNLPYNKTIYLENIMFIFFSIAIILSFVFSYNHIYHFKKNTNNECNSIDSSTFYTKHGNENDIYILKEINLKNKQEGILSENKDIINNSKNEFSIKFKVSYKVFFNSQKSIKRNFLIVKGKCMKK